jgi:hypothetical protein
MLAHTSPARRLLPWSLGGLVAVLAGLVAGEGCTVASKDVGGSEISPCSEGCPGPDASTDGAVEASQVQFDSSSDPNLRNANCGTGCNPDSSGALSECSSSTLSLSGRLVDSEPTPPGQGELSSSLPLGINDPTAAGGSAGASGAAGAGGATSPTTDRVRACHVVQTGTSPVASCIFSGQALEGEACRGFLPSDKGSVLLTDCAPGLACVRSVDKADSNIGQCRPYCCYGGDSCGAGAWCAPRRVFDSANATTAPFVPVCTPADSCKLLEDGACPQGQTCQLVADQTTSCDVPGKGKEGQSCPCAAGLVCSRATNSCRTLCHTELPGECAQAGLPNAVCTGGSGAFPPGLGVCTGG